jgi:hypothetical protein
MYAKNAMEKFDGFWECDELHGSFNERLTNWETSAETTWPAWIKSGLFVLIMS